MADATVRRVCFGVYVGNRDSQDADAACGSPSHSLQFGSAGEVAIHGGARPLVVSYGVGATRGYPRAADRSRQDANHAGVFAAQVPRRVGFGGSWPGRVVQIADGQTPSRTFTLSLAEHRVGRAKTYSPGAISNDQAGENILRCSYHQLVARFGPP